MTAFESLVRRIVRVVDVAAGLFLAVITASTFVAVVLRYVFALPFPGSFDVSRLLLGVAIFWGIAVAAHRDEHIRVDLLRGVLPRGARKAVAVFADCVFALFMGLTAWMLLGHVQSVRRAGQTTFELSLPLWPFYAIAWLGGALGVVVVLARIARALLPGAGAEEDDGHVR